jgi:flagellar biosynthesis anti-sigma factor FlgM
MKVNDQNLNSLVSTGATKARETERSGQSSRSSQKIDAGDVSNDDVHLSELVRSLRSLAADSPERQARIEQLARAYAKGSYSVDPDAVASKLIEDAFEN